MPFGKDFIDLDEVENDALMTAARQVNKERSKRSR